MKIDIYEDGISYVTDEVSTVPTERANLNEENRIKFVTDLAAVSRGAYESRNPKKRYESLLREAAPTHQEIIDSLDKQQCPECSSVKIMSSIRGGDGALSLLCDDCGYVETGESYAEKRMINERWAYKYKLSPSRPLEFLPVVLGYNYDICGPGFINIVREDNTPLNENEGVFQLSITEFSNLLGRYSYLKDGLIYTNMRAVINAGIPYEDIPYNTPSLLKSFKALRAKIPMFVWGQVPNTHTAISKEAQSDRVSDSTDYWLPNDFIYKIKKHIREYTSDNQQNNINRYIEELYSIITIAESDIGNGNPRDDIIKYLLDINQASVTHIFKLLGYRKEIYSRAIYYFKYKECVMTGWATDPNVWDHLFLERNAEKEIHRNWTQKETEEFVNAIKEVVTKSSPRIRKIDS